VSTPEDERFMRGALALGRRNLGLTWPNPSVGALVVRPEDPGALIVGQGVTAPGGRPHGEPLALDQAGLQAAGATLYVTLEPCSHRSVRGAVPCVEAILRAGVRRVVSAVEDPNPLIAGLGHALLRSAGVSVATGLLQSEAARDHRGHFTRVKEGRPTVTLKLAMTADGFAAADGPERLMITGPETQAQVHLMRARFDGILVGVGTVAADDPLLTVRLPGLEPRSPLRIVLDSRLSIGLDARVVTTAAAVPTWIVAATTAPMEPERVLTGQGLEVLRVDPGPDGRVSLPQALRLLGTRGLTRLFCEGGPRLADALAAADLIDELVLARSPRPLGRTGIPAVGPRLAAALTRRLREVSRERAGADELIRFERAHQPDGGGTCSRGS
jgi:diaminohydroxyphosphoribosylaminopyrimidine deaminase / 5-amino-6-(5-phosphoribosylamino)uracil reductase